LAQPDGRPSSISPAAVSALHEQRYEDALQRQADLTQLAQIAASYATRERFLTELTLDPPDATSDQAGAPLLDEDYLILSTIHSAKGQNGRRSSSSTSSTAAFRQTSASARRRRSRRNAASLRRHDAGQGSASLMVPQRFFGMASAASLIATSMRSARASSRTPSRTLPSRHWPRAQAAVLLHDQHERDRHQSAHARHVGKQVIEVGIPEMAFGI